jgi:hypothetical protein
MKSRYLALSLFPCLVAATLNGCVVDLTGKGPGATPASTSSKDRAPIVSAFDYSPKTGISKSDFVTFTLVANDPEGEALQYNWTTTKGTLTANAGSTASWRPMKPDGSLEPGQATVSVIVSDGSKTTTASVTIMIDERGNASFPGTTPDPTPTAPVATPVPPPPTAPTVVTVDPANFTPPQTNTSAPSKLTPVTVNTTKVKVRFRDDATQDGDRVKIAVNGTVVKGLEDLSLTNAGQIFELDLVQGVNTITITALNEGSLSPNTQEVSIDATQVTGGSAYQLSKGLKTGESESLQVTVQ